MKIKVYKFYGKDDSFYAEIEFDVCPDFRELIVLDGERYRVAGKWFDIENNKSEISISLELEEVYDNWILNHK